jgi:hypothetical protein
MLAGLQACTPAFDWRSVRLPDTQLVTELPCRPSRFQRDVAVAGVPLKLFMLSCEAGGVTYGVATADVVDPARVDAVLHALRDSAGAAIRSADSPGGALNMSGVTPFSGNTSAHLHGQRPDGAAVDESVRVFARGTRVFQARTDCASTWKKAWLTPVKHHVGAFRPGNRAKGPRNAGSAPACGQCVLGLPGFQADNHLFASFHDARVPSTWPLYC